MFTGETTPRPPLPKPDVVPALKDESGAAIGLALAFAVMRLLVSFLSGGDDFASGMLRIG
ncbi:MAG: hypothetical protein ACREEM_46345 [Blastocatellia bacterium]